MKTVTKMLGMTACTAALLTMVAGCGTVSAAQQPTSVQANDEASPTLTFRGFQSSLPGVYLRSTKMIVAKHLGKPSSDYYGNLEDVWGYFSKGLTLRFNRTNTVLESFEVNSPGVTLRDGIGLGDTLSQVKSILHGESVPFTVHYKNGYANLTATSPKGHSLLQLGFAPTEPHSRSHQKVIAMTVSLKK
jgi:hypothetical protein